MTLAKCAAWPPSWNRVLSPLQPLPTWAGLARLVKLTTAGTHSPPARSSAPGRGRSRSRISLPSQQIQGEGGAAVLDAEPAKALDPILQRPGEGHVRVELAGHVATHAVAQVVGQQGRLPLAAFSSARLWCSRCSVPAMKSSRMANSCAGLICSFLCTL